MNKIIILPLITVASLGLINVSHAATIAWDATATDISGDSDVSTVGIFEWAYSMGNSGTTYDVNGVTFTGLNAGNTDLGFTGMGSANATAFRNTTESSTFDGLSVGYQDILGSAVFGGGTGTANINLASSVSLPTGHKYQVQFWVNDARRRNDQESIRNTTINGTDTQLVYNAEGNLTNDGLGQFITGTFTADGATSSFGLFSAARQLNAIQLRDVTNIGYWTGLGGATWDANTTSNFASNAYNTALVNTTFDVAEAALSSVTFGDAYWANDGTTAVTQNTVTIAAGGVSTGSVDFINTGALAYTINGVDATGITGDTAVNVNGGGSVTFADANTYTGDTNILNGSLTLQDQNSVQNSTVTMDAGGLLIFDSSVAGNAFTVGGLAGAAGDIALENNAGSPAAIALTAGGNNADTAYAGALTGAGSLIKVGTGTLTVTGNGTFTGGTTINGGTIQVGDGGTDGALGTGDIVNNGALVYSFAANKRLIGSQALPSNITGTGSLEVTAGGIDLNSGAYNLTGAQTWNATATSGRYFGFNLINGSTVTLTSDSTISMTGYLGTANNGTLANLVVDTSSGNGDVTLDTPSGVSGVDFGLNSLTVNAGTGTINLGTFNGKVWNQLNTMSFTGGAINSTANMTDFSSLTVNNTDSSIFSGELTASGGSVIKNGGGILVLSGTNSYGGTTTVNDGTLQIGDGDTTGAITGTSGITNNGSLIVNRSNAFTQATDLNGQAITGTGSFTQAGLGVTTLTAVNTYTGATMVNFGTLIVDGSLDAASDVSVALGAGIGGSGTIGGNLFLDAGAQFLFSTTETLTVQGTMSFGGGESLFSVANLIDLDSSIAAGTYTIVSGNVDFSNLSNVGLENAFDLGEGKSAYFQEGSLQLVVVPEPGTYALLAGLLGMSYVIVRRRK